MRLSECETEKHAVRSQYVRGLSLVLLCHRFGRRARTMMRSLAMQEDFDRHFRVVAYYADPVDAELLVEGATSGPRPPRLELVAVAEDRIMNRSKWFASYLAPKDVSHVVFIDADLYLPPSFLACYVEALERNEPGYWSCHVKEVPEEPVESLLVDWRTIDEKRLDPFVLGARYDTFRGTVGHFQCTPRGLAEYPELGRDSVDTTDLMFASRAMKRSKDPVRERRIGAVPAYHLGHPRCWSGTGRLL